MSLPLSIFLDPNPKPTHSQILSHSLNSSNQSPVNYILPPLSSTSVFSGQSLLLLSPRSFNLVVFSTFSTTPPSPPYSLESLPQASQFSFTSLYKPSMTVSTSVRLITTLSVRSRNPPSVIVVLPPMSYSSSLINPSHEPPKIPVNLTDDLNH